MNDPFLMSMLHRRTDLTEQLQPLANRKLHLIAVIRQRDAFDQFHHEVRPPLLGHAPIQHLGDVGMIHHGQCLAFGFKASQHLPRIHPGLDQFDATLRLTGSFCSANHTLPIPPSPIA
jgi:hypothetical protein